MNHLICFAIHDYTHPLTATLQASDSTSTARVVEAILQMCFDASNWVRALTIHESWQFIDLACQDALNDNIIMLSKRRGQLKNARDMHANTRMLLHGTQAVTKMVQRAMVFLDTAPNKDTLLKLIDTLRTVTAGKVCISQFTLVSWYA